MVRPSGAFMEQDCQPVGQNGSGADRRMQELYEAHGGPLYRFILRLTLGERQAAEDLVQETLLRAWRKRDELTADVATLRPWLFTVARRLAIDAIRAKRARPPEVGVADMSDFTTGDDAIDRMLDTQVVRLAMQQLSPEHRGVLIEIYYRGRSVAEAATLLGIPEGTVKSRTYHGLRALRAALDAAQSRA